MSSENLESVTTVLIVDEHDQDRLYWAHRLRLASSGYVIFEAKRADAALELLRFEQFDCVVLELDLPDMSGLQLLIHLVPRIRRPEMAVVVLTRNALSSIAELAMKNGAQACLIKSRTSGDMLDKAIQKAIAVVGPRHKEKLRE